MAAKIKPTYEDGHIVMRIPITPEILANARMSSTGNSKVVAASGFQKVLIKDLDIWLDISCNVLDKN